MGKTLPHISPSTLSNLCRETSMEANRLTQAIGKHIADLESNDAYEIARAMELAEKTSHDISIRLMDAAFRENWACHEGLCKILERASYEANCIAIAFEALWEFLRSTQAYKLAFAADMLSTDAEELAASIDDILNKLVGASA